MASAINARAALLMLTVYDEVDAVLLAVVGDDAVVLVLDAGVVDAEPEFDVMDVADACTVFCPTA